MALFGRGAAGLERFTYSDDRRAGALHTGALLGALAVAGVAAERLAARRGPAWTAAVTAAATFVALGGTSLTRTGDTDGRPAGAATTSTPPGDCCRRCAGATRPHSMPTG